MYKIKYLEPIGSRAGLAIKTFLAPFNIGHLSFISSAAAAQFFPIITIPVVSRLYTPSDFGVYAVYFALATILTATCTFALTNAVLLEDNDRDASHAALLAISVVAMFSGVLMATLATIPHSIVAALLGKIILPHLYWLPFTISLSAVGNVLYTWSIRRELFSLLSINKIVLAVSTAAFQIIVGLLQLGALGFILANLCGLALTVALLLRPFLRDLCELKPSFAPRSAWVQIRKHRKLPLWTVPANLINSLSQFLPDLIINNLFGAATLGQYSLYMRLVNFPMNFISSSVQDIFYSQSTKEFISNGYCSESFKRVFWGLLVVSSFILFPIILIAPYFFSLVMGNQWIGAVPIVHAIGFLLMTRFVSSPLSYVWMIRKKYLGNLAWQLGLLGLIAGSFYLPATLFHRTELLASLWTYSLVVGGWYVFSIIVSWQLARGPTR